MSFSNTELSINSNNMFDVELLKNYLSTSNEISFSTKSDNDNICFTILPDTVLKIKKVKNEDCNNIIESMKVNCNWSILAKNILNILEKNKNLFALSEMIACGVTYFDSIEKNIIIIEEIKQNIEMKINGNTKSGSNQIIQIILDNYKLECLVNLILNNANNRLIFTPTEGDRCAICCFVLLSLLHQENPLTENQICFISPDSNCNINAELTISTDKWLIQNNSLISQKQNLSINLNNKSSCFMVLNDCDIHSAVVNYLNYLGNWSVISERPKLCLIQENIYEKFIIILNEELEKSKASSLFDKNRRLSLTCLENGDSIIEFLKADTNIKLITADMILQNQQHDFYFPLILDNVQPQDDIFNDKIYSKIGSFLLTFRHYEEAVLLANKLYRQKSSVYLWTENISLCFDLKSKLDYDKIYVNMSNVSQLLSPMPYSIKCNGSLIKTDANNSFETNQFLSTNQISLELESLLKSTQEISNRFARIHEIIDTIVADKLISSKSAEALKSYVDGRLRNCSNYNSIGALHILSNQMPVGNIVLYLGNIDISEYAIQLILLSWLLGNKVLVISAKDLQSVATLLISTNRMKSLSFIKGLTSIRELNNCSIESVVAFDWLISNDKETFVDLNFLYFDMKCYNKITNDSNEIFDGVLDFIGKKKLMYILAGGINTL